MREDILFTTGRQHSRVLLTVSGTKDMQFNLFNLLESR